MRHIFESLMTFHYIVDKTTEEKLKAEGDKLAKVKKLHVDILLNNFV